MNPIAAELNDTIKKGNIHVYEMLSAVGKDLFFPKGILSQGAEAKEKAHRFNATIGMATEKGRTMHQPSVMASISGLKPEEALSYAPSFGLLALRKAWKKEVLRKNPSLNETAISLPVVTHAITHALSVVSDMWVDPDDVIILPDKMWGNYNMIFCVRNRARIAHYPLFDQQGKFNLPGFEACLRSEAANKEKIIVLLNFPNNPTGYTLTPQEADGLTDIMTAVAKNGTNILAITDDAYFGLFYDENILKESVFARLLDRDPRLMAIKLDGVTKENYAWGLRVGFFTYGPYLGAADAAGVYDALEKKTAGAVRGSISNASRLSQSIMLKSLQSDDYYKEKNEKFEIMRARAQEVKRVLADPKYGPTWEAYPFNSGYFMCLKLRSVDAETLRTHLLEKYGVGLISLGKSDLRVAFSCIEKADVTALFDTIRQAASDLTA
jgi:aspartate/methionine/tyrosine aminotransferase